MSSSDSDEDITPQKHIIDENADLPALFWDAMPENPEEHPDFVAMQALAEESTLEERAENFKVQPTVQHLSQAMPLTCLHGPYTTHDILLQMLVSEMRQHTASCSRRVQC